MSLPADVVPVLNDSRYWLAGLALVVLFPWLVCPGAVGRSAFLRSWAAAMAIIWSSGILLLLPWLAAGNDYRQVMTEIEIQIQQKPSECLLSSGLGEPQRALLEYYAGIQTQRLERAGPSRNCQELLVQSRFSCKALTEDRPGWQVFWHGGRPGGNECFSLYQKPVS